MRLENVFEGAGAGEITVGFELEIIVPSIKPKEFWSDEQASDLDNMQVKQIQVIQNKYGLTQHADDSVVPGPDDWDTHHGTEYDIGMIKGPGPTFTQTRLRVTPSDFLKVATIIKEFFEAGAYVNATCGFHAHFGLGPLTKTSPMQTTWFAMYFIESGLWKKYTHYNGIAQYEDSEYASLNNLKESVDEFRTRLEGKKTKQEKLEWAHEQTINSLGFGILEKYNLLHPHRQGTLEWRGLRGVFNNIKGRNSQHYKIIADYLRFVYGFANDLSKSLRTLDNYDIGGITLTELRRFYHEHKMSGDSDKGKLIQIFSRVFDNKVPGADINMPIENLKRAQSEFIQHVKHRTSSVDAKRFGDRRFMRELEQNFNFVATNLSQFMSEEQFWMPESQFFPRVHSGEPILLPTLQALIYTDQTFMFDAEKWTQLVRKQGTELVNCVFEDCFFMFTDPDDYKFKPLDLFIDCTFENCKAVFGNQQQLEKALASWSEPDSESVFGDVWLDPENGIEGITYDNIKDDLEDKS